MTSTYLVPDSAWDTAMKTAKDLGLDMDFISLPARMAMDMEMELRAP